MRRGGSLPGMAAACAFVLASAVEIQAQGPAGGAAPRAAPAAAPAAAPDTKARQSSPLSGFGSNSKEPYKIDANRLEVTQKEDKAVYSGDVVVIQGKMTMRCTTLLIFFEKKKEEPKTPVRVAGAPGSAQRTQPASVAQPGQSGLRRLECLGPVSVTQEKQTATSNLLVYEADIVTLTGNVIVADGDNVQAGEKLVYNTKSGIGTMEGDKEKGRVRGIFLPGSSPDGDPSKKADKKAKTG